MINTSPNSAYLANRQNSNQSNQNNRIPNVNWNYQPGVTNRTTNNSQPMRSPTTSSPVRNIAIANTTPAYPQGMPQGMRVVRMSDPYALQRQQQALLQQRMQYQKAKEQRDNFHKTINTLCLVAMGIAAVAGTLTLVNLGKADKTNDKLDEAFNKAKNINIIDKKDLPDLGTLTLSSIFNDIVAKMDKVIKLTPEQCKKVGSTPECLMDRCLLFYGPPGNGKTTFIQALAKKFECDFVEIKVSDISSYYKDGGTLLIDAKLNAIEEHAKKHPDKKLLVFFDEVDSILGANKGDLNGSEQKNKELNSFKTGFDRLLNMPNILIASATNKKPEELDSAMLSRMKNKYFIKPPEKEQLFAFFNNNKPDEGFRDAQDLEDGFLSETCNKVSDFLKEFYSSFRTIKAICISTKGDAAISKDGTIKKQDLLASVYKERTSIETDLNKTITEYYKDLSSSLTTEEEQRIDKILRENNSDFNEKFAELLNAVGLADDTAFFERIHLKENNELMTLLRYEFTDGNYVKKIT